MIIPRLPNIDTVPQIHGKPYKALVGDGEALVAEHARLAAERRKLAVGEVDDDAVDRLESIERDTMKFMISMRAYCRAVAEFVNVAADKNGWFWQAVRDAGQRITEAQHRFAQANEAAGRSPGFSGEQQRELERLNSIVLPLEAALAKLQDARGAAGQFEAAFVDRWHQTIRHRLSPLSEATS